MQRKLTVMKGSIEVPSTDGTAGVDSAVQVKHEGPIAVTWARGDQTPMRLRIDLDESPHRPPSAERWQLQTLSN